MGSLNLDPVQVMVERDFLDDLCDVLPRKNAVAGNLLGTLDPVTHAVVPPAPAGPDWSGPCAIVPINQQTSGPGMVADNVVPTVENARYKALLPLAAPIFEVDQILVVTGSRRTTPRDPAIVGSDFRIVEVPAVQTFAVVRIVFLAGLNE